MPAFAKASYCFYEDDEETKSNPTAQRITTFNIGQLAQILLANTRQEYKKHALIEIGKRALDPNNADQLFEKGAIDATIACLKLDDEELLELATKALINISVDETSRDDIYDGGGIPLLVQLLQGTNENVQANAAWVLINLTNNDANKDSVREIPDAVPRLIALSQTTGNSSLQTYALKVLANLSESQANQRTMADVTVLVPLFKVLVTSRNMSLISYILYFFRNLTKSDEGKVGVQAAAGLKVFLHLLKNYKNPQVLGPVLVILTNISDQDNILEMLKLGALQQLLPILQQGQEVLLVLALTLLRKIGIADARTHKVLVKVLCEISVERLLVHQQLKVANTFIELVHTLISTDMGFQELQAGPVMTTILETLATEDMASEAQETVLSILLGLTKTPNKSFLHDDKCLTAFIAKASSENLIVQQRALHILAVLALDPEVRIKIAKLGGLNKLLAILSDPEDHPTILALALVAMNVMMTEARLRNVVIKTRRLRLSPLLQSPEPQVAAAAQKLLHSLKAALQNEKAPSEAGQEDNLRAAAASPKPQPQQQSPTLPPAITPMAREQQTRPPPVSPAVRPVKDLPIKPPAKDLPPPPLAGSIQESSQQAVVQSPTITKPQVSSSVGSSSQPPAMVTAPIPIAKPRKELPATPPVTPSVGSSSQQPVVVVPSPIAKPKKELPATPPVNKPKKELPATPLTPGPGLLQQRHSEQTLIERPKPLMRSRSLLTEKPSKELPATPNVPTRSPNSPPTAVRSQRIKPMRELPPAPVVKELPPEHPPAEQITEPSPPPQPLPPSPTKEIPPGSPPKELPPEPPVEQITEPSPPHLPLPPSPTKELPPGSPPKELPPEPPLEQITEPSPPHQPQQPLWSPPSPHIKPVEEQPPTPPVSAVRESAQLETQQPETPADKPGEAHAPLRRSTSLLTDVGTTSDAPSSTPELRRSGSLIGDGIVYKITHGSEVKVVRAPPDIKWQDLRDRIFSKFPALLRPADISIKYKDQSGDLITLESNEDLEFALELFDRTAPGAAIQIFLVRKQAVVPTLRHRKQQFLADTGPYDGTKKHVIDLSKDITMRIFSFLPSPKDLACASMACKQWSAYLKEQSVWKDLFQRLHKDQQLPGAKPRTTTAPPPRSLVSMPMPYSLENLRNLPPSAAKGNETLRSRRAVTESANWKEMLMKEQRDNELMSMHFQCTRFLKEHSEPVTGVQLHHSGTFFFSSSFDGTVKVWETGSGVVVSSVKTHRDIVSAINARERYLFTASWDRTVKVWDLQGVKVGRCISTLKHDGKVNCIQSSSSLLFSGGADKVVKVSDPVRGETLQILKGHTSDVSSLAYNGEDNTLFSGGNKPVFVWDINTSKNIATLNGHSGEVNCIQADPNRILTGSWDKTVKLWDPRSWLCEQTMRAHTWPVRCLQYDEAQNLLVTGSSDKTLKVWDLRMFGECLNTLEGHSNFVSCLSFVGKTLVSGSDDCSVRMWDLSS